MKILAKNKYLRKNEFRIHTNPAYRSKNNKSHVAYVTLKHGKLYQINAITHSKQFKNRRTSLLPSNPHKNGNPKDKSRISIPFWEHERYLRKKVSDFWFFTRSDRIWIKKHNKSYYKRKKNSVRK